METQAPPSLKELLEKAKQLPAAPGVYLMKDKNGNVLYVGKAKALHKRVSSYFRKQHAAEKKTAVMVSKVCAIDTLVTATEKEALILENNLIKAYRPRYNVIFRDDKEYPYLRLSVTEPFPNLTIARKPKKDGNLYFGPFASAQAVRETLKVIKKLFPLRKCSAKKMRNRRPCVYYQLGQCLAPCAKPVSRENYRQVVKDVQLFLQGRKTEILPQLKKRMDAASENLDFELAARLRDQIAGIEKTLEKQVVVQSDLADRDVFSSFAEAGRVGLTLLFVRAGRMSGSRHFRLKNSLLSEAEILFSFVSQYYQAEAFVPDEILLPVDVAGKALLRDFLRDKKGAAVRITVPKQGAKKKLLDMAYNNARIMFEKNRTTAENTESHLQEIAQKLHLSRFPARIECFDISNIMGTDAVGSMAVFENGEPLKREYRRFRIRSVHGPDDYAMMNEVLRRHLNRVRKGAPVPDLILVDGGKGQLGILRKVLAEQSFAEIPAAALAKGRPDRERGRRTDEKVFIPGRKNPVVFPKGSRALLILQHIRDEAHRFAVTYHKTLKKKRDFTFGFEALSGVGPKTAAAVTRHFGSLKNARKASLAELEQVPGLSRKKAADIFSFFRS